MCGCERMKFLREGDRSGTEWERVRERGRKRGRERGRKRGRERTLFGIHRLSLSDFDSLTRFADASGDAAEAHPLACEALGT